MRGVEQFNFPLFHSAAADLRSRGWVVASPAEHDKALGFDETAETLDGFDIAAAITWDLEQVRDSDAIIILPDWEQSKGVAVEKALAEFLGKRIFYFRPDADGNWQLYDYPPRPFVVGLSGVAGSGKDTAAAYLVAEHGFTRVAFADALRKVLYHTDPKVRRLVDAIGWDDAKHHPGAYVRERLQWLGVAMREHADPDIWVNVVLRKLDPDGRYVLPDCRFPNEMDAIKSLGGQVVRNRATEHRGCQRPHQRARHIRGRFRRPGTQRFDA